MQTARYDAPGGFTKSLFLQLVSGLADLDCVVRAFYGQHALEVSDSKVRPLPPPPYVGADRITLRAWGPDAAEALERAGRQLTEGVRGEWAPVEKFYDDLKAEFEAAPEGRAYRAKREARRRDLRKRGKRVYVRFNEPPEGGYSRNFHDGLDEGGLCVFAAYQIPQAKPGGTYVVDPGENLPLALQLLDYLKTGTRAYLATGRRVGRGSSGEPLLSRYVLALLPSGSVESLWEYPASWWQAIGEQAGRSERSMT